MPYPRPKREDMPKDPDLCDVHFELRSLTWRIDNWMEDVNGDIKWVKSFRSKISDMAKILLVTIPIFLAAVVTLHMTGV